MGKQDKIILEGILLKTPNHHNGRIYSEDFFDEYVRQYNQKHKLKIRRSKLNNIIKNI
jgi:hypothetical protein